MLTVRRGDRPGLRWAGLDDEELAAIIKVRRGDRPGLR